MYNNTIRTSHFPVDPNYLVKGTQPVDVKCSIQDEVISAGQPVYSFESYGREMYPKYICEEHVYLFKQSSLEKPYWLNRPNIGACNDMRIPRDRGWREGEDGLMQEWIEEWGEL